jgi:hypothetical protein
MKSNELRTGNLLNYDTAEGETLPTKIDWQDLKWLSEDEKGFNLVHSPIPITEEWLLKFGFTNIDNTNIYVKSMHKIGAEKLKSLAVYIDENNYTIAIVDYYTGVEKTDLLHLDYEFVHQLQNLYFALTGEELTII